MKLSIITINYNNLEGLRKTIESVKSQTWKEYEWIIIDGGSTDGCRELIEQNKEYFAFWCCERDVGVFNAMNKGIAKASGEYLNFMNSGDTFCDRTVLESVFCKELPNNIGVLYGDYYEVFSDGKKKERIMPKVLDIHFIMHMPINHQSTFINRKLLSDTSYDESYRIIADWKAFLQWLIAGVPFYHLDNHVANFDMNGINQILEEKKNIELERAFDEIIPPAIRKVINDYDVFYKYPTFHRALRLFETNKIYFSVIARFIKLLYSIDGIFHRHKPLPTL